MAASTVNWVFLLETWLNFPNSVIRLKVGYDETTGLHVMRAALMAVFAQA